MKKAEAVSRSLQGRRIILGVTGGIAAYKAAHLARQLIQRGGEVRVVMTRNARRFVSPMTFAALTQAPVTISLWSGPDHWSIDHVANARWGDLLLVAPASANAVAKFAHGIADDALSTLYLAWSGPVVVAPAMHTAMYEHRAYRANEAVLRERGVVFVDPGQGDLASGDQGRGRLAEIDDIVAGVERQLAAAAMLAGVRVVVTAGPTREFLDPIRFLSNPSSGKMGFALAEQAARAGAQTTLVAGPVNLSTPPGVERIDVVTANEMFDAVMARCDQADLVIFAAAVADFAPERTAPTKIKKRQPTETLRLRRTPDIARAFGQRKRPGQLSIGFAADTARVIESARAKRREKNFDLIVANPVRSRQCVFGSDHNRGWLVGPAGRPQRLARMTKTEMAGHILLRAAQMLRAKKGG